MVEADGSLAGSGGTTTALLSSPASTVSKGLSFGPPDGLPYHWRWNTSNIKAPLMADLKSTRFPGEERKAPEGHKQTTARILTGHAAVGLGGGCV